MFKTPQIFSILHLPLLPEVSIVLLYPLTPSPPSVITHRVIRRSCQSNTQLSRRMLCLTSWLPADSRPGCQSSAAKLRVSSDVFSDSLQVDAPAVCPAGAVQWKQARTLWTERGSNMQLKYLDWAWGVSLFCTHTTTSCLSRGLEWLRVHWFRKRPKLVDDDWTDQISRLFICWSSWIKRPGSTWS